MEKEKKLHSPAGKSASIALNSRICIEDLDSGEEFNFTLVSPESMDTNNEKLLISTPLAASLMGREVESIIHWTAPSRLRRFRVKSVC